MLEKLFAASRGRVPTTQTLQLQKRRVQRLTTKQPGLAFRTAGFFDAVLRSLNAKHGLDKYPLRLPDIIKHMTAGEAVMEEIRAPLVRKAAELQGAIKDLTTSAGRGVRQSVVSAFARSKSLGSMSTRELSDTIGQSPRYVLKAKEFSATGNLGVFGNTSRTSRRTAQLLCPSRADPCYGKCEQGDACTFMHACPSCHEDHAAADCPRWNQARSKQYEARRLNKATGIQRNLVSASEGVATRDWMVGMNPAKSGDQKEICWMVKGFSDFYHEDFHTVKAQMTIIRRALDLFGDNLREEAKTKKNAWLRNVATYLAAEADGALDDLRVKVIKADVPMDIAAALEAVSGKYGFQKPKHLIVKDDEDDAADDDDEEEKAGEDAGQGDSDDSDEDDMDQRVLVPRSTKFFYKTICKGMRLWKRPPHNHCDRCAQYVKAQARVTELQAAVISTASNANHEAHAAVVKDAGGSLTAWEEIRLLQNQLPDLKKHMDWQADQRPYSMRREKALTVREAILYLDYGGFTDSGGKKVSVWSVTVIAKGRPQEHFDIFFDQGGKKVGKDGNTTTAKKNGQTGIAFLGELFDPAKSPTGDGVSMFQTFYPDITGIILSGDTGNGYRAYEMLEELSKFFTKYGLTVQLMPLPPGHAWNRCPHCSPEYVPRKPQSQKPCVGGTGGCTRIPRGGGPQVRRHAHVHGAQSLLLSHRQARSKRAGRDQKEHWQHAVFRRPRQGSHGCARIFVLRLLAESARRQHYPPGRLCPCPGIRQPRLCRQPDTCVHMAQRSHEQNVPAMQRHTRWSSAAVGKQMLQEAVCGGRGEETVGRRGGSCSGEGSIAARSATAARGEGGGGTSQGEG